MNRLPDYIIHLADNALILGHRNSEWTGHGPILEQDIALSNIALDLIGQARNLYQYAATLIGNGSTEDSLAYLRDSGEFLNCLIAELPNGDWAKTVTRQFFFSTYQYYLYQGLQHCYDTTLSAIAVKSLKEVAYHLRWSSEWVIRLGDGTTESKDRMENAITELWSYSGELYTVSPLELSVTDIIVNPGDIKNDWMHKVNAVFDEAGLQVPENKWMHSGGKKGIHTEHMGALLAEMQFLQRAYPDSNW